MIRKLILAAAAVMALSAGAQAQNSTTVTQNGGVNNSNTVQQAGVQSTNTAMLTQMGFFNNSSAGQTGLSNTSTQTQGPIPGLSGQASNGAASNAASLGQLTTLTGIASAASSNTATINQTASTVVANFFGLPNGSNMAPPPGGVVTQQGGLLSMNTLTINQLINP